MKNIEHLEKLIKESEDKLEELRAFYIKMFGGIITAGRKLPIDLYLNNAKRKVQDYRTLEKPYENKTKS